MQVTSSFFDNIAWITWDYCGIMLVLALLVQVFVPPERRWLRTLVALCGLAWCGWVLGIWCNTIVIYCNDGHMPVRGLSEMEWVIRHHFGDHIHVPFDGTTRLKWLADIFHLPSWVPPSIRNQFGIFSLGDALLWSNATLYRLLVLPTVITLLWAWLRKKVTSRS